jgi:hypothetical protein
MFAKNVAAGHRHKRRPSTLYIPFGGTPASDNDINRPVKNFTCHRRKLSYICGSFGFRHNNRD